MIKVLGRAKFGRSDCEGCEMLKNTLHEKKMNIDVTFSVFLRYRVKNLRIEITKLGVV